MEKLIVNVEIPNQGSNAVWRKFEIEKNNDERLFERSMNQ
jgi:hypothetical protein